MVQVISRDELKRLIDNSGEYVLIDVRENDELVYGMIPTAKSIPLSEINYALDMEDDKFEERYGFKKLNREDNIIFYCRTGNRSESAALWAITKGFVNAKNFLGSIWSWSEIDPDVKKYGPPL